jgi:nuclear factor related to kappa-B-binding protein
MYSPSSCYTYRLKDFSVTVGPIRGVAGSANLSMTPSKGKCHPLLVADRPAYVTIIVIVRDAVARLKNGEGTRQHICELVKESQFINQV